MNSESANADDVVKSLGQAGLSETEGRAWMAQAPVAGKGFVQDRAAFGAFWKLAQGLLDKLPAKARRSAAEQQAGHLFLDAARESRERFLRSYVTEVYDELTTQRQRLVRVEDLASIAAHAFPGLVPAPALLAQESQCTQRDKDGHEIDQGLLFSHILAHEVAGMHLCHAMLLPHPKSQALADEFKKAGRVDLHHVFVEREGRAAIVNLNNQKYLNAEDESTVEAQELAVDICLLDEQSEIGVLRGARMESGKYQGRRVFSSGINLTHLYHGKVSYLWYLKREMGWLGKVFRGLADPDHSPDEMFGHTREKMWLSAVDSFAIGGGCQYMLALDLNIAASDAYMTLPARKEGIVPGAANLRLPRFVGDRIARQAVMMERRIECDSPAGRLICDRIVAPGTLEAVVKEIVESITRSGMVSAASNRRAFRVAHEPLDLFRRYMAVYAREQAYCHFSPALISNLEKFWGADKRSAG